MRAWQDDLLSELDGPGDAEHLFHAVAAAARALGFEHCAYGLQVPVPVTAPRITMLSTYPGEWHTRYLAMDGIKIDPVVALGRKSQQPILWRPAVFERARALWEEAKHFGIVHGWSQSNLHFHGTAGLLSLSRSGESLTAQELAAKEGQMRWLVSVAHAALANLLIPKVHVTVGGSPLTQREIEVLKWSADGKTSSEISDILSVSENTVNFHVKNAVGKLGSANKTSAVVRALVMGLLV